MYYSCVIPHCSSNGAMTRSRTSESGWGFAFISLLPVDAQLASPGWLSLCGTKYFLKKHLTQHLSPPAASPVAAAQGLAQYVCSSCYPHSGLHAWAKY